jgi:hypothetical protein
VRTGRHNPLTVSNPGQSAFGRTDLSVYAEVSEGMEAHLAGHLRCDHWLSAETLCTSRKKDHHSHPYFFDPAPALRLPEGEQYPQEEEE